MYRVKGVEKNGKNIILKSARHIATTRAMTKEVQKLKQNKQSNILESAFIGLCSII